MLRFSTPCQAFHSVSNRLPLSGASHDLKENGIVGYSDPLPQTRLLVEAIQFDTAEIEARNNPHKGQFVLKFC